MADVAASLLKSEPYNHIIYEEIRSLISDPDEPCWFERNEKPSSRKETWDGIVRTKDSRIGVECPKEIYATRFRGHNDKDPRVTFRYEF